HDPRLLDQINEWRKRDASWFGPGDDVWHWTNGKAKAITNYQGGRLEPVGQPIDLFGAYRILATAAERGATILRRDAASIERALAPPGLMPCHTSDEPPGIWLVCDSRPQASESIARSVFDNTASMLSF